MTKTTSPLSSDANLLLAPMFRVQDHKGVRANFTLPHLYARLADPNASTIGFTALQAHQAHAWHAFLVQVAAMVLHRAQKTAAPTDPVWWTERLRALGAGDAAWTLVVPDLSQPAFMQPPVPEGSLAGYKTDLPSPGALDLLVTAKNHDRKLQSGDASDPAAWVYALVSVQTQQGYSGKNNYGIARMNGGLGNRPGIGLIPGLDLGAAFRRDVAVLGQARSNLLERGMYQDTGLALTWTAPWDGTTSLPLTDLDPWAVESCRRIRLRATPALHAVMASTAAIRVKSPEESTGNVGDPWTPIGKGARNAGKSLTLPSAGFTYQRVVDLLLGNDWEAPPAQNFHPDDGADLRWRGRALVRGQGKTEGYHEREIPIPATLHQHFVRREGRERLAQFATEMVQLAGRMRDILRSTLKTLWEDSDGPTNATLAAYEAAVDTSFFRELWRLIEADLDTTPWREELKIIARNLLNRDIARIGSRPDRWQRISGADRRFHFLVHLQNVSGDVFLALPSKESA